MTATGVTGTPRERRPASSYLAHEGDVLVPSWFVAWLDRQVNLQQLHGRARDAGPQYVEVVGALLFSSVSASPDLAISGGGRKPLAVEAEMPAPSAVMSATEAAGLLAKTPRRVRQLCSEGALPARLEGGEWRISRSDLDDFRATRAA